VRFICPAGSDFSSTLPTDVTPGGVLPRPQATGSQLINRCNKSLTPVELDLRWVVRTSATYPCRNRAAQLGGRAEQIDFYAEGWQANNVRITNDPAARIELRADKVADTKRPYETESRRPDSVWCSTKGCPCPSHGTRP